MLIESPYVEGRCALSGEITVKALTWEGREFLDSVRNPETWAKTKEGAHKIGTWSISLLSDMAKAYAKHLAKEKLGLDLS